MAARSFAGALALAAGATLWSTPAVLAAGPSPTPDPVKACQGFSPLDGVRAAIRISCDIVQGGPGGPLRDVTQSTAQAAGQAGQAVADAAETAFTKWVANGAAWILQGTTVTLAGSSTTPSLDPRQAALFSQVYGRVAGVALSLSVLLVLIGIIEATLSQRPGGLRRVIVGIAASGIGLGVVPIGTAILVRIVDDLSTYVAGDQSRLVAATFSALIQLLQQTDPAASNAAFAFTSLGVMLGGLLLWLELVTREALIYLFVGVAPLACAAVQWPRLEGVLRHVLFAGLALILSKLVIIITLAVGFAVLMAVPGLATLVAGMFIIVIAAVMPFATARILPLAAEELSHIHQGRLRGITVGTTGTVASAIATAGGAAAAGVPIAPALGAWGARRSDALSAVLTAGRSQQVAAAGANASESPTTRRSATSRPATRSGPGGDASRES